MYGPPIGQACAAVLWATVGRNPTWAGHLVVEKPWEHWSGGRISLPGGVGCWGMASPDIRHTMQGSLAHAGHVGARIPEAQVKVLLLALPSSSWVVGLGVGRALPQTKGWFTPSP